jgi:copper transport protein
MGPPVSGRRLAKAMVGGVATAAVVLLVIAGRTAGHAILVSSNPPDGASLAEAPDLVTLTFSEAVSFDLGNATLTDADGHRWPLELRRGSGSDAEVALDLPPLDSGTYRVSWTAVSGVDLHVVSGWTVFGVGMPLVLGEASPAGQDTNWLGGIADWVLFSSLAVAIGVCVMVLSLMPAAVPAGARRPEVDPLGQRFRATAIAGVVAAIGACCAIVVLALLPILAVSSGSDVVARYFETPAARWSLVQVLFLGVALVGVIRWRPGSSGPPRALVMSAVALVAALAVRAAASHQVALATSPLDVAAWVLHSGGAAVWVGCLVAIAVLLLPLNGDDLVRPALMPVLRRFSPIAAACVAVLTVTGLFATGKLVASVDALLLTDYGHILIVKIVLAGGVALLGLRHAARLHRSVRGPATRALGTWGRRTAMTWVSVGRLQPSLRAEAVGGLAIIFVAACLASTRPATGPEFAPIGVATVPETIVASVDDLLVTTEVSPGRAGENFVNIGVFDTRRPAMAPIRQVEVSLRGPAGSSPIALAAEPIGDGRFETPAGVIGVPGAWKLEVTVVRPGLPLAILQRPVEVGSALIPSRAPVVSNAPLGPPLQTLAIGLAVGFGIAAGWASRRRWSAGGRPWRRTASPEPGPVAR